MIGNWSLSQGSGLCARSVIENVFGKDLCTTPLWCCRYLPEWMWDTFKPLDLFAYQWKSCICTACITGFLYGCACENALVGYKTLHNAYITLISGLNGWLGVREDQTRRGELWLLQTQVILENVIFYNFFPPSLVWGKKITLVLKTQTKLELN